MRALLYHCAPSRLRASIRKHGIDPSYFLEPRSTEGRGFYAFLSLEEARWYAQYFSAYIPIEPFDIWAVRPTAKLVADSGLSNQDEETSAVYHLEPAQRARLVAQVGE